jgi:hypothetical protein
MEKYLIAIQLLTTAAIMIGIYKNKIDTQSKKIDQFSAISERLARLEEKVNFLLQAINQRYEKTI